jgi:hypothetical protein
MADTLQRHVADPKYLRRYISEYLDARFASIDAQLAELRALILLQSCCFTRLEASLDGFATRLEAPSNELDVEPRVNEGAPKLEARLTELSRKVDARGVKLDEILARLPKPQL